MKERLNALIIAGLLTGCADIPPIPTPPPPTVEITPTPTPEGFIERQEAIRASYRTPTRELTPTRFLIPNVIVIIVTEPPVDK